MNSLSKHIEDTASVREIAKRINTRVKELFDNQPAFRLSLSQHPQSRYFSDLTSASEILAEDESLSRLNWSDIHAQSQVIRDSVDAVSGIFQNHSDLPAAISSILGQAHIDSIILFNMSREKAIDEQLSFKSSLSIAFDENKDLRQKIKELNEYIAESSKELNSLNFKVDEAIKNKIADLKKTAANVVNDYVAFDERMKLKEDRIDNMLGRASGAVISNGFSDSGKKELKLYYWLRGCAIGCLMVVPAVIWYFIFHASSVAVLSTEFFSRLSLIISLVALATYLAKESSKHRVLGSKYTQTGLYLSTLDPYLESLEESERNKIKAELALKLFFSFEDEDASDSMPINPQEIINKLIDIMPKGGSK